MEPKIPQNEQGKMSLGGQNLRLFALGLSAMAIVLCLIAILYFIFSSRNNAPNSDPDPLPSAATAQDVAQAPDPTLQKPPSSPEQTFAPSQTSTETSTPTDLAGMPPTMTAAYTATFTPEASTNTPPATTSTHTPDIPTPASTATPTFTPISTPTPEGTATATFTPSPTMAPTLDPCAVMSITNVIIEPGSSAFYLTNAQMQIIDITRITYSWAAAGPLSRIDLEPEILMTFNPPEPPPIYVNSSQFNQRAPIGFGTRALIFRFSASSPTAAHTLTIEFDGLCTITHIQ